MKKTQHFRKIECEGYHHEFYGWVVLTEEIKAHDVNVELQMRDEITFWVRKEELQLIKKEIKCSMN